MVVEVVMVGWGVAVVVESSCGGGVTDSFLIFC